MPGYRNTPNNSMDSRREQLLSYQFTFFVPASIQSLGEPGISKFRNPRNEDLVMKALTAAILLLFIRFDCAAQSLSPTTQQIEILTKDFYERGQFN